MQTPGEAYIFEDGVNNLDINAVPRQGVLISRIDAPPGVPGLGDRAQLIEPFRQVQAPTRIGVGRSYVNRRRTRWDIST